MTLSLDITSQESFIQAYLPSTLTPEKALLAAVIEDALETFTDARYPRSNENQNRKTQRLSKYREARRWVFAQDEDGVFSFIQVCEWLGIDPTKLRQRCRQYDREATGANTERKRGLRREASRANWSRRYVRQG